MDVFGSFYAPKLAFVCAGYTPCSRRHRCDHHPPSVAGEKHAPGRHSHLRPDFHRHVQPLNISSLPTIFPRLTSYPTATAISPLSIKSRRLWSGQEGSLAFGAFLLSVYVISRFSSPIATRTASLAPDAGEKIPAASRIFFLTLNNFVESPFQDLCHGPRGGAL